MHENSDLMQGFTFSYVTNKVVYSIFGYLGQCEALHEITVFVHEMLSVCAPLVDTAGVTHNHI